MISSDAVCLQIPLAHLSKKQVLADKSKDSGHKLSLGVILVPAPMPLMFFQVVLSDNVTVASLRRIERWHPSASRRATAGEPFQLFFILVVCR